MTTRKRLLALIVLLLLACRLPYAIGRRLSSSGEADSTLTPTGTSQAVSIYPQAGTAAPTGLSGFYPGATPSPFLPGDSPVYPGLGGSASASPGPGDASVYPGISPLQTTLTPGVFSGQATGSPGAYPGLQNPAVVTPPPTVIPSPTPFLTPTPTLTHTPTVTPTPLPPPAWSRANLYATDPRTVKLASGKVQLVEFFAFWSGPSQAMSPLVQGVESEYGERVNFVYLDIDDPAVAPFEDELKFDAPPHFFLLAPDGTIIDDWVGYITLADLRAKLESALNP